jgi:hypothetical protein
MESSPPRPFRERRRARRMALPLAATVTSSDASQPPVRTHSVDLSQDGVLLACIGLEGQVRVSLQLPGGAGRIDAVGEVARSEPGRTAVRFTHIASGERQLLKQLLAAPAAV